MEAVSVTCKGKSDFAAQENSYSLISRGWNNLLTLDDAGNIQRHERLNRTRATKSWVRDLVCHQ